MFSSLFVNKPATTEIYTLSLHDALPISGHGEVAVETLAHFHAGRAALDHVGEAPRRHLSPLRGVGTDRSEEHTSELQSRLHLVCRLLLEKKKQKAANRTLPKTSRLRTSD